MSDFVHHPDDETLRLFAVGRLIVRVDPHGPAWRLPKGAEIQSINDQSGSAAKLRTILDSLHFGDPVTVRYVPMGSGGSGITSLFHAE